ncbi:MAG TPA: dihydroorotate dehydrogenase electron transfer subunit [Vicinamibacteria bacterium]|nr:dihydroorotate dehydrogenase electron transfer subunit [Vicinamibacteria bacterium]
MPANRLAPLVSREPLGGAFFLLTFAHPETAREARPGQFVMIKAGTSAEPPLRRPFSILSADPASSTFSLFVKAIGPGSRALCALEGGEVAQCLGPLGRPFTSPPPGSEALLVAGGYGVAPFRFMADEMRRSGARARLFYGGRTAADLPLLPRLSGPGLTVLPATEDGSLGARGRVTVPLEAHLDGLAGPRPKLYACGPDAMMHAVARIAERRSLPAELSLDPWMGCGVGTCLGCVVRVQSAEEPRPKYCCACTEGPVFDAARVVWPGDDCSSARRHAAERAGARG